MTLLGYNTLSAKISINEPYMSMHSEYDYVGSQSSTKRADRGFSDPVDSTAVGIDENNISYNAHEGMVVTENVAYDTNEMNSSGLDENIAYNAHEGMVVTENVAYDTNEISSFDVDENIAYNAHEGMVVTENAAYDTNEMSSFVPVNEETTSEAHVTSNSAYGLLN